MAKEKLDTPWLVKMAIVFYNIGSMRARAERVERLQAQKRRPNGDSLEEQ